MLNKVDFFLVIKILQNAFCGYIYTWDAASAENQFIYDELLLLGKKVLIIVQELAEWT